MKSNRKNTRTPYIRPTIDWSREYDRDLAEDVRKYVEQWRRKMLRKRALKSQNTQP